MLLIYVVGILLAFRLAWHIICAVRYYRSAYFKSTRKHYLSVMHNVGGRGEYFLYRELKDFEKTGARFLFNTYLPRSYGRTTEVDVIMIHTSGIFVFENKNYAGWIFGNPNDERWTQRIQRKNGQEIREEQFLNPIQQNSLHIRCLQKTLREDLPIYSVIAFGNRCQLKNISESITEHYTVCRTHSVKTSVVRIGKICGQTIKQGQVEQLYDTLRPYSQATENLKKEHISNIQKAHAKRQEAASESAGR